jgi:hypothetical protein
MATTTKQQLDQALTALFAVSETLREVGEIPSGVLYSQLMNVTSFEGYERMLGILKGAGLIAVENNVIRWIGPNIAPAQSERTVSDEELLALQARAKSERIRNDFARRTAEILGGR